LTETIFVVDDNDINLAVAEDGLEKEYNVVTLPSGKRLFEMLEKLMPSLILLDIVMPEMDGFEVIKRLKSSPKYKSIPVIFLTGTGDEATENLGYALGAADFIHKPFSASILQQRIRLQI